MVVVVVGDGVVGTFAFHHQSIVSVVLLWGFRALHCLEVERLGLSGAPISAGGKAGGGCCLQEAYPLMIAPYCLGGALGCTTRLTSLLCHRDQPV